MGITVKEQAIDTVCQVRYNVERFNGTDKWVAVHKASDELATPSLFRSQSEGWRWLFTYVSQHETEAVEFVMAELRKTR